MYIKICRKKCIFLSPKEELQKKRQFHKCYLFNQILKHNGYHPRIQALSNCFIAKKIKGLICL